MGQSSRKLKKFLKTHPVCCFCGGHEPAQSIDHVPAKALFLGHQRPKSHEFPACIRCNSDSRIIDQITALTVMLMGSIRREHVDFDSFKKLAKGVARNSPTSAKYILGEEGQEWINVDGLYKKLTVVEPDRRLFTEYLNPWGAKLGLALWYRATKSVFPVAGAVHVKWFSNEKLPQDAYPKEMLEVANKFGVLKQGSQTSEELFRYKWIVDEKGELGWFFIVLFNSSALMLSLSCRPREIPTLFECGGYSTSKKLGIHFKSRDNILKI